MLIIVLVISSCGENRFKCQDDRATYFDEQGFAIKTKNGISKGYVLIPSPGDAGSFMLGHYVHVENGLIVENIDGIPELIKKNTYDKMIIKNKLPDLNQIK